MTEILHLTDADKLSGGFQRNVYRHPHNPSTLIKVLIPDEKMEQRTGFSWMMDKMFPATRRRQIRKEYDEYIRVMLATDGQDITIPVSHIHGFIPTNLGLGCVTEAVLRRNGELGRTLRYKIRTGTFKSKDLALLNDTVRRIYQCGLRASDMTPANFVFGRRGSEKRECVLVDGFGDLHAIPVRSMGRFANQFGLDDSFKRLARKANLLWDASRRQFTQP